MPTPGSSRGRVRRDGGRLLVVRGPAEIDWFFSLIGLDLQLELVDRLPVAAAVAA